MPYFSVLELTIFCEADMRSTSVVGGDPGSSPAAVNAFASK
jgi:hypothetical protein